MVSRNEAGHCDEEQNQKCCTDKSDEVKKVEVPANTNIESDSEDSDMDMESSDVGNSDEKQNISWADADTQSVHSNDYDYANADTDSADSDFDYDFIGNIDTDSADSDCEEVELDKSLFQSPPRRRIRRKRVMLPRWTFVPPVSRDGQWVMPVQQCDANLSQMVV